MTTQFTWHRRLGIVFNTRQRQILYFLINPKIIGAENSEFSSSISLALDISHFILFLKKKDSAHCDEVKQIKNDSNVLDHFQRKLIDLVPIFFARLLVDLFSLFPEDFPVESHLSRANKHKWYEKCYRITAANRERHSFAAHTWQQQQSHMIFFLSPSFSTDSAPRKALIIES